MCRFRAIQDKSSRLSAQRLRQIGLGQPHSTLLRRRRRRDYHRRCRYRDVTLQSARTNRHCAAKRYCSRYCLRQHPLRQAQRNAFRIEAAALAANAHDFIINDLPDGYETAVGERGVKLSGRQRRNASPLPVPFSKPRILDPRRSDIVTRREGKPGAGSAGTPDAGTHIVCHRHRLSTVIQRRLGFWCWKTASSSNRAHTLILLGGGMGCRRLADKQFRQRSGQSKR